MTRSLPMVCTPSSRGSLMSGVLQRVAKEHVDDRRVVPNLLRRALRQRLPLGKDVDSVAQPHDETEVVVDDEDAAAELGTDAHDPVSYTHLRAHETRHDLV